MDFDLTQLASSLGIAGPLGAVAIITIKRMAERFVNAQDKIVERLQVQSEHLSTLTEITRQSSDRMTRVELRLNRLQKGKSKRDDEEDTDPNATQ